jgi:hypothetical protein
MRLDGDVAQLVEPKGGQTAYEGSSPSVSTKPDMQALRDICAGKIDLGHIPTRAGGAVCGDDSGLTNSEIPICSKTWWEDGEQYECLMDKGHRETKHGMRGMVRRLDA